MPVLLLGLLVVLAGLAIGGFAGRLTAMHAHLPTSLPSISPVPTETPTLAPVATPTPKRTPKPKVTPSPKPTPKASARPSPSESPSPSPTPSSTATPSPAPSRAPNAAATPHIGAKKPKVSIERTARPSPVPSAAVAGSAARALVRVYLADLARGDTSGASALLAAGSPDTFIDGTLQITSVTSAPTASGAQSVTANIIVGVKHYVMSFLVGESGGALRILSHQASSTIPSVP
ncbi:MAG: hypothetical protein PXZ07_06550 [Candidatus Eremiobacteraeota bacterium]|nr:hypothetical protein [Candidatus Eremiobacteraeota bacterium]